MPNQVPGIKQAGMSVALGNTKRYVLGEEAPDRCFLVDVTLTIFS